jgi:hypothetical protein
MEKSDIINLISEHLENNINELSKSLEDYRSGSDLDESDTRDMEDFSQQSEQKEMQYQMQIQLDHVQSNLIRLNDLAKGDFSVAKPGAIVDTDKNLFLLGISVPPMPVGDKELIGLSPESPAFGIINGKSAGDHFELGNNTYTIKNIL